MYRRSLLSRREDIVIIPTFESGRRAVCLVRSLVMAVAVGLKGDMVEGGAAWRKPTAITRSARTRSPRPRSVLEPAPGVSAQVQLRHLPGPIVTESSQLWGC